MSKYYIAPSTDPRNEDAAGYPNDFETHEEAQAVASTLQWAPNNPDEFGEWIVAERTVAERTWTFESYWNVIMGEQRTPEIVVHEFDLQRAGLDEWLGVAESEAWLGGPIPREWEDHHREALRILEKAISG